MNPPVHCRRWWGEWLRREQWHLAALAAAIVLLVPRFVEGPRRDPWRAEQQQVTQQLARVTSLDRETLVRRLDEQPWLAWRLALLSWGGMAGIGLGIVALWRALRRRRRGQPAVPWRSDGAAGPPVVSWTAWDAVKLFAWVVCGTQLLQLAAAGLLRAAGVTAVDRHMAAAVGTLVVDGLAVGLIWLIILRPHQAGVSAMGIRRAEIGRQVRIGLWGYLAWLPLLAAAASLVMLVTRWLHVEPQPQAVVAMLLEESRPRLLLLLMGLIAVLGPVAEELVFRGVTYPALRRRWGVRGALGGSALLFAGLHTDPFAFGPILVLGVWLGWLYERTGSLLPSLTVHIIHNTVMLAAALTVRDLVMLVGGSPS